jgi:ribose transport system ATP-binding protein
MLGRELNNMFPARVAKQPGDVPMMKVQDLWPDRFLERISFDIYPGEILGLAGQLGSGTGDILAAIAGATQTRDGNLVFKGRNFLPKTPKEAIDAGIAYCSDDRKHDGLFLGRPISDNLSSAALKRISTWGVRSGRSELEMVTDNAVKFTVDPARLPQEAGVLSGGNQQKVALAKWLAINPDIILVNEPTRGVDVGARAEIYQKLRELADEGAAIVVASTDIQEITNLPDRVITIYRGIQVGEIALEDMTAAAILKEITDPFDETGLQEGQTV